MKLSRSAIPFAIAFTSLSMFLCASAARAQTESVLYSFGSGTADGTMPVSGLLLDSGGNLYGTTAAGGTHNNGTVFKLARSGSAWTKAQLYSFGSPLDGKEPWSGLVQDSAGNLYGTTIYRGQLFTNGTFYRITPGITWTETGIYTFPGGPAGANPYDTGKLIRDSSGNFYGTTAGGGAYSQGAVFEISISGDVVTETVIYSFDNTQSHPDGAAPKAGLIMDSNGNLYGTTVTGGAGTYGNCTAAGCGTVFELFRSAEGRWSESVLYSFNGGAFDGANPNAELLLDPSGNLFGTTLAGGTSNSGTVFELSPTESGAWKESVIHKFGSAGDGSGPHSGLTRDSRGNLYGTTYIGGAHGGGTVFKLSPVVNDVWTETVLWGFGGRGDGKNPYGGVVIDSDGNLYGTTNIGGSHTYGTVFKLVP